MENDVLEKAFKQEHKRQNEHVVLQRQPPAGLAVNQAEDVK